MVREHLWPRRHDGRSVVWASNGAHRTRHRRSTHVPAPPVVMAQQALSTQAAVDGRFTLGIGLSHQIVIETMFGLSFAKPYSHMKEYLAVLAPLIREGMVSHTGEEYRVNVQLNVPGARPCPILLAALAPRMLALTGRAADGTITW